MAKSNILRYNARSKYPIECKYPRNSAEFAEHIKEIQRANGLEVDGMFGYQTYLAIREEHPRAIIKNCEHIPIPPGNYVLRTFEDPDGLDLHRYGNFSARKSPVSAVCLHWGGLDAKHCFNVFSSDSRDVSSHFLIGVENGVCVVYQVLDLKHRAWHAGKVNDFTIGIDICQQPQLKWNKRYNLPTKMNPTHRGDREVLTLDPVLAEGANAFIKDLMNALDLPIVCPPTHDVHDVTDYTLFGHHHVSKRKWDVACWWEELTNG